MSYATEQKEYRKYKKNKRLELNKQYPKGGRAFIKAVSALGSLSFTDYKALLNKGVKPVSTEVVKAKIDNSKKTNKNIVKAKKEIEKVITAPKKESPQPKAMPQSIKDMRAKNKTKEDSKNKVKKEVAKIVTKKQLDDFKNSAAMQKKHGRKALTLRDYRNNELGITKRRTDVSKPSSKEKLYPSIFSNQKITQKELVAEIAKEKANPEMKKAKFNQPDKAVTAKSQKAIDAVFKMLKKKPESKKANMGGYMTAKKKMMGGGYAMKKKK